MNIGDLTTYLNEIINAFLPFIGLMIGFSLALGLLSVILHVIRRAMIPIPSIPMHEPKPEQTPEELEALRCQDMIIYNRHLAQVHRLNHQKPSNKRRNRALMRRLARRR